MKKFKRQIKVLQSDCTIISNTESEIDTAIMTLKEDLDILIHFTDENPHWKESYDPIYLAPNGVNNKISVLKEMEEAVKFCNVGPMAAVAGVLADRMQRKMLINSSTQIAVVENGGEICIKSKEEIIISLIILSTSLKSKIGFRYPGNFSNLGVATSSATFGHANSLGDADAVVVFAPNAGLADAAATKICNETKGENPKEAIMKGIKAFRSIPDLLGVFIVVKELTATDGNIPELVKISDPKNKLLEKYDLEVK